MEEEYLAEGSCSRNWKPLPDSLQREIGDSMISPPALGLWCLITKCKCKFTATGRVLAECLPDPQRLNMDQSITQGPPTLQPAAGVQAMRREKAALTPLKGGLGRRVLFL